MMEGNSIIASVSGIKIKTNAHIDIVHLYHSQIYKDAMNGIWCGSIGTIDKYWWIIPLEIREKNEMK